MRQNFKQLIEDFKQTIEDDSRHIFRSLLRQTSEKLEMWPHQRMVVAYLGVLPLSALAALAVDYLGIGPLLALVAVYPKIAPLLRMEPPVLVAR
mmetsp:Transcript_13077/g.25657  ORF Transcript_13077/g.25657 Transcript_13077/m.25657 type:complete len:94 (+) Transcript_13077:195-476(+)